MAEQPKLLRIPTTFRSVEDVLECAKKMDLPNVVVLSERENGSLVMLTDNVCTLASCNWLLDRMKMAMLLPDAHHRTET